MKKFRKPQPRHPVLCWALFPLGNCVFRTLQQVNTAILPLWQLCLAVLALLLLDGDGQHHGPDHLLHQHHLQVVQGQGAGVGAQEVGT